MKKFMRLALSAAVIMTALNSWAAAPKYVFYMIGDGMGPGQVLAAETYNRMVLGNDKMLPMMQLPVNSLSYTYSASSPVTDSAAAGTALSTGVKTKNSMLGMNPDTVAVYSIAKDFHDEGYGVGIITTVALDDATPGAFYAHVPARSMYYEIGRQAAESGYEVIGGASLRGTVDKKTKQPNDLIDYIKASGVDIVEGVEAMGASDSRRVMLLPDHPVWSSNMGYAVDQMPGAMTLDDMLRATIAHLSKHTPDGFFIMAEGGSIDHAGHANDAGTVIKEMLSFNDAIQTAIDFYNQHPDETLIVITADHETGGLTVGNNKTKYAAYPQYLAPQKYSKDRFSEYCDELMKADTKPTWPEMKQFLTDNLGFFTDVPISEQQEARLAEAFDKTFYKGEGERVETLYVDFNPFPVEVYGLLNEIAGFGWTTSAHSGNPVPLYAIGAGSEAFAGQNNNIDIPIKIRAAALGR